MKTKIETDTYPNGQKWYEIPHVNGKRYGLATWWYENGQKIAETTYVNGQQHGLVTWWHPNGSLSWIQKWHQDQKVWEINFSSKGEISENAEVELFFYTT